METIVSATIKWNNGMYEVFATVRDEHGKESVKLLGRRGDGADAVDLERESIGKEFASEITSSNI